MLRFIVRDTGIGIPENKIGGLFSVFTQVDATITRRFGGTGLGLSISRQLAGMMGGSVGVKSEPGKGSEFWVTVQLDSSTDRMPDPKGLFPDLLRGGRVLLADGNLTGCEAMAGQLNFFGMRAEFVQNWTQAVEKLNQAMEGGDPFLFMVADIDLQGMNPVDSVRKLKEDHRMENLSIILLSSAKGGPNIAQPEKIGFSLCLNKPLHHLALPRAISGILMKKDAAHTETRMLDLPSASPCRDASAAVESLIAALVRKGGRILLVEDIVTNQIVAIAMLKKFGLQTDAVSNGREAIFALEKMNYDLVLMDLQMPEMDGYETTRRIREPHTSVLNSRVPIIAMTAHVMQSDQCRCLEAGMNDFISKPILIPTLAKVLAKWLLRNGSDE